MITLITGAPGAGKSAALVSMLMEFSKGRAVYANGIPDLKVEHQELAEPTDWMNSVPDGSIIVIDEVQRIWRPSGPGQKVPLDIAALETHRHRGLDFYIITQAPRLVHGNVRGLVGRHVHLRDIGFLGRWWYEWPETADNCAASWKNAPIKKRYKLPKAAFGMYKSASEHIKPVRSFPKMAIVAVLALAGVVGTAYYASVRVQARVADAAPKLTQPGTPGITSGAPSVNVTPAQPAFVDDRVAFIPRMTVKPESAPAYDALRVVAVMPVVAGGICKGAECKCVTQQGTDAGLTSEQCKAWMGNVPFNPYAKPEAAVQALNRPDGKMPLSGNGTADTPGRAVDIVPYKPGRLGDGAKAPGVGNDNKVSS